MMYLNKMRSVGVHAELPLPSVQDSMKYVFQNTYSRGRPGLGVLELPQDCTIVVLVDCVYWEPERGKDVADRAADFSEFTAG